MHVRRLAMALALVGLVGVVSGDAKDDRLRIDVTPRVSAAPAAINVKAFVSPDEANRALRITVDSGSFYRSSFVQLEGADASSLTETRLKNLPGGEYDIVVTLVDTAGSREIERTHIIVTGIF